ncbi:MAG: TRAP transporter small permease [Proteobacteria bacterium]|nr:TRAP transporter small permease [Pseudomonadota bacterium]
MDLLQRIDALTARASTWLVRMGAAALAIMMLLTFLNVAGRKLLNNPIVGAVEMTELLMGLIVFLGIAYTTYSRSHVTVDIITSHLPDRARGVLALAALILSAGFVAFMSWRLWVVANETVSDNLRTQVWELPVYPAAYLMAAGSMLMVLILLVQIVQSTLRLAPRRGAAPSRTD